MDDDIAFRFGLHRTSVSRNFWTSCISEHLYDQFNSVLITWPCRYSELLTLLPSASKITQGRRGVTDIRCECLTYIILDIFFIILFSPSLQTLMYLKLMQSTAVGLFLVLVSIVAHL